MKSHLAFVISLLLVLAIVTPGEADTRMGAFAPDPTGTGFYHSTASLRDTASKKVDTTNAADVTVPSTASGVVTSSGTVLQQASNVLAGSSYVSVGSSPATVGHLRFQNGANVKAGTSEIFDTDSNNLYVGSSSAGANLVTSTTAIGSSYLYVSSTSSTQVLIDANYTRLKVPLLGISGSPYGAHGYAALVGTNGSLSATAVTASHIKFTSASADVTVDFPRAATGASAYWKRVWNATAYDILCTNYGAGGIWVLSGTKKTLLFYNDAVDYYW